MRGSWILQLAFFHFSLLVAQGGEPNGDHRCSNKRTCGDCISADPKCSWCKQEGYGRYLSRCDSRENLIHQNCTTENIVSPESTVKNIKDLPLSEAGVKTESYVQMKPQQIRLQLRPHKTISFPVVFRQAEDYPLDLYYLMDLTYSMRDDKDKLFELGGMLVDSISNMTSNFRLGFGSFVDKVVLPYVNTVPSKLENPCLDGVICAPPYGFRNHMPLSYNRGRFAEEVQNAQVSANLDDAEGGFDAIMQVIVCKKQIDWNDKSRKIVLFATHSGFHYAGDGKLGGIVVPNDGECHLDADGYYNMSTLQDYPSLSQVNRTVKENKVNIIFAVPKGQMEVYKTLSAAIEGAYTRELAKDSSNIVELVRRQYEEISSEVELRADNIPDNIQIRYSADCPNGVKGGHLCKGLKVGTTVNFNVSIMLESCPKSSDRRSHTFSLYPVGLGEALKVQLEMLCECDCEKPDQEEMNSDKCSDVGTYECGTCSCYNNYFGRNCECNSTKHEQKSDFESCRIGNQSEICSDRGECVCGICECFERPNPLEIISGPNCECDNFNCLRDKNQQLCGGPKRGSCNCGVCQCTKEWKGDTCSCSTSNSSCINSRGEVCSGKGECVCNQCRCFETTKGPKSRYVGQFCEECPTCAGKCEDFKSCVECRVWKMGEYSQELCQVNCSFNITVQSRLPDENVHFCLFQDKDGCTFQFTHSFNDENRPVVVVLDEKECPRPANLLAISLGVAGGILVAGIIVALIVRFCIFLKDRRDYARFMEEVGKTNWGKEQNPLYKAAVSNYTNPTYGTSKAN